jgi:carbonic anhydrase/acetyltransferase-like protein (isoleucine patch superfamily)
MPEMTRLHPVYGHPARWRVPNSEAPRMYGFNLVRLVPEEGAKEIAVDFRGFHDPAHHGDWRACIVAVDGEGRARYSPLWNKGEMRFARELSDRRLWLTVAATPSAMPLPSGDKPSNEDCRQWMAGVQAPRFPWEVALAGCKPGSPHRRQGDVINLDELYSINNGNKYKGYPVKSEVPIPLADKEGPPAQEKLADMGKRVKAAADYQKRKLASGEFHEGTWWEIGKTKIAEELTRRIRFLQRNARGQRHPNGGGFVSDNCRVARSAYVGPNAMVLDGARVEGNACIHEHAVVLGPGVVVRDNARIGGKAWVAGNITVGGSARILETATVTTVGRARANHPEGQGEITGNAVVKGDHILRLCRAKGQMITGELVMDYTPGSAGVVGYRDLICGILNLGSGVFRHGRIYGRQRLAGGEYAGGLYANWEFDRPMAVTLEDSYVNNNGILFGSPAFGEEGKHRYIQFNGKNQYAEAPPSIADFAQLTVDMLVNRDGGGRLFDFGTGDDACFYLEIEGSSGKPALVGRHKGKSYRVAGAQAIPPQKWVNLRVEMDGSRASLYAGGKELGGGKFALRPCDVFPGDRPVGNTVACGRNKEAFFKGKLDHFRIYRDVLDDFGSLGSPPSALLQAEGFEYHTTMDWDRRIGPEAAGKLTPKMKEWLPRVRGD